MQTTQNITLKRLLALVAERGAANLHLVVGNKPVMRVAGELITIEAEEVINEDFMTGVLQNILTPDQQQALAEKRELIVIYEFAGQSRFRVDITHQRGLHSMVFHFLPSVVKRLENLGFPKEVVELTHAAKGIVFVSGPHDSGVTTTLGGFVETINHTEAKHILTIEQPVELSLVSYKSVIEQQEVGEDVTDWLAALDIAEQDLDVIVLGKIPSAAVAKKIVEVAAQGVLVFVGMMATSTEQLFEQFFNMLEPQDQKPYAKILADVYRGSVIQQLVPRIGGGQVLALELALEAPPLKTSITDMKFDQIPNIIQTSRVQGMILLDRYLAELVKSGQIERDDAFAHAVNTQALETMLGK